MTRLASQTTALILFAIASSTQAALVERDWLSAGDSLITYDTETGLEWLDVPVTSNMTYNDVLSITQTSPEFSGFSFASKQHVETFFNSAGLQTFFDSTEAPEEVVKVESFLSYWGVVWYIGDGQRTEFLTSNTEGLPEGQHWSGRLVWFPPSTAAYTTELDARIDSSDSGFSFGSALVRNAEHVTLDGDVNEDGVTDAGDYRILLDIVLGEPVDGRTMEPGHADYYPVGNPDGIIDISDLVLMRRALID